MKSLFKQIFNYIVNSVRIHLTLKHVVLFLLIDELLIIPALGCNPGPMFRVLRFFLSILMIDVTDEFWNRGLTDDEGNCVSKVSTEDSESSGGTSTIW